MLHPSNPDQGGSGDQGELVDQTRTFNGGLLSSVTLGSSIGAYSVNTYDDTSDTVDIGFFSIYTPTDEMRLIISSNIHEGLDNANSLGTMSDGQTVYVTNTGGISYYVMKDELYLTITGSIDFDIVTFENVLNAITIVKA